MDDKCFACARAFRKNSWGNIPYHPEVLTEDGAQRVFVGYDCYRKIVEAGAVGYQPPLGGPRLFAEQHASADVLRAAGIVRTER